MSPGRSTNSYSLCAVACRSSLVHREVRESQIANLVASLHYKAVRLYAYRLVVLRGIAVLYFDDTAGAPRFAFLLGCGGGLRERQMRFIIVARKTARVLLTRYIRRLPN